MFQLSMEKIQTAKINFDQMIATIICALIAVYGMCS